VERNWALLAMNDPATLRASIAEALETGRPPVLMTQQALLQLATADFAAARASAEEVLKSDPVNEPAARIIAESYVKQNQPAKALARLTELAKAAPQSARLQYLLGTWQLHAGRMVEAREQFEAARRIDPRLTAADLALADLDRTENRVDAARTRLQTVLSREPGNIGALLLMAEIEKAGGNHTAAVDRYRTVLAIDSSIMVAFNNLSTELMDENLDEALGLAQRAFDLAPENPAVQDTLGWIYYRKGIYHTATKHLKAAVAQEPNPRRQLHLGLCYIKSGDVRQGRELMQIAIRQDPSLSATAGQW